MPRRLIDGRIFSLSAPIRRYSVNASGFDRKSLRLLFPDEKILSVNTFFERVLRFFSLGNEQANKDSPFLSPRSALKRYTLLSGIDLPSAAFTLLTYSSACSPFTSLFTDELLMTSTSPIFIRCEND